MERLRAVPVGTALSRGDGGGVKLEGSSVGAARAMQGHAQPPLLLLEDRFPVALPARLRQILMSVLNQHRQRVRIHLGISFSYCNDGKKLELASCAFGNRTRLADPDRRLPAIYVPLILNGTSSAHVSLLLIARLPVFNLFVKRFSSVF